MSSKDGPAAALQQRVDGTKRAMDRIDADPEEARDALEDYVSIQAGMGEITPSDMFKLMTQMQAQLHAQQTQIAALLGKRGGGGEVSERRFELAEEMRRDKEQREATLEAWKTEVREPVWLQPDIDEQRIHKVTGLYPPRVFYVNGLEFSITPGEIVSVPTSIAVIVRWTQHQRSAPAQAIERIDDPNRSQFLAGSQAISMGYSGQTGEGRVIPESVPLHPQELGYRYDHHGQ